jgi:hypothetical protein
MSEKDLIVDRKEDMSPEGKLRILMQDDGDMIVECLEWNDRTKLIERTAAVEFCTHAGGGRSPKTRMALLQLAHAMAEENKADPDSAGDWLGEAFLDWIYDDATAPLHARIAELEKRNSEIENRLDVIGCRIEKVRDLAAEQQGWRWEAVAKTVNEIERIYCGELIDPVLDGKDGG